MPPFAAAREEGLKNNDQQNNDQRLSIAERKNRLRVGGAAARTT